MTRASWVLSGLLIAGCLMASAIFYDKLPAQIPIHWGIHGQPDRFGDKSWAAFLCPMLMVGIAVMFAVLPWLSPRHFEVERFRKTYMFIFLILMVMCAYIHGISLAAALRSIDVGRALVAGICIMLALLGNVMGKVQRNFYIGVRTPWTLASDRVWADTHRLAAWTFVVGGLVGFVLALLGGFIPAFVAIIAAAVIPAAYSLYRYKTLERSGGLG